MRTPRMWAGMNLSGWFRLLLSNRSALGSCYKVPLVGISLICPWNSILGLAERLIWHERIRKAKLEQDPLFVIGHWRTGTTWLHELLGLDERHSFPTSHQCFTACHFLLTEPTDRHLLGFVFPSKRPMDNMAMGFDSPQEDEFAMCNLGQVSPYLSIAFPNEPFDYVKYLDLEAIPPRELDRWKKALKAFLKLVNIQRPGRVVLKSPTHTCRIRLLLQLFPNAQFVHIVRNPYDVFPSTINLWKKLYRLHGLQKPTFDGLEEVVFENFLHLYQKVEEARPLLRDEQFFELHYEDLVENTTDQLRSLYDHLNLGGFEALEPRLLRYMEGRKTYKPNRYEISPELHEEVGRRWGSVIEQYGYAVTC